MKKLNIIVGFALLIVGLLMASFARILLTTDNNTPIPILLLSVALSITGLIMGVAGTILIMIELLQSKIKKEGEMKKFVKKFSFVLILLLSSMPIMGCGSKPLPAPTSKIILKIARYQNIRVSPGIIIGCRSARLDYDARKIIIDGAAYFGSKGRKDWNWIGKIEIENNKLVFKLPLDDSYEIVINEQYHLLPKIVGTTLFSPQPFE